MPMHPTLNGSAAIYVLRKGVTNTGDEMKVTNTGDEYG
jgi:hypothetical protein